MSGPPLTFFRGLPPNMCSVLRGTESECCLADWGGGVDPRGPAPWLLFVTLASLSFPPKASAASGQLGDQGE